MSGEATPKQPAPASARDAANCANAQHSTGPKTEEGKRRSRFNAFRHGLTGKTVVMPWQDRDAYEAFCQEFFHHLKPEGVVEREYVQTVADCSWRLNSAAAAEANLLSLSIHERAGAIQSGSEETDSALAEAKAFREESQVFTNISLYCQRLARQRDKALEQLRLLQNDRKQQRAAELREAAAQRNLHTEKKIPGSPPADGFVFSTPEIDAGIARVARQPEALCAASSQPGEPRGGSLPLVLLTSDNKASTLV